MKFVEVAIAIIHRSGLVLISRRLDKGTFANLWEFPGGKIEPGESPDACAVREVDEELGLFVRTIFAFPVIEHIYPEVSVRIYPYLCAVLPGEPQPFASEEVRWVPPGELNMYPFPAANKDLLGQIIEKLAGEAVPEKA